MGNVATATGDIDAGELGRVLMHEHVFVISTERAVSAIRSMRFFALPPWAKASRSQSRPR